jgi:8-oxo-dGTP pyrophosphatase MutT (NUDIX family)
MVSPAASWPTTALTVTRVSRMQGRPLIRFGSTVICSSATFAAPTDNGNWALPGGAIDLGESVAQAAVRETLEESGIGCSIVGIYSDPKHVILYTSNSEVRREFSIVLSARPLRGRATPSSESSEVRWAPEAELPGYTMDRSMRIRINDFLAHNQSPVVT